MPGRSPTPATALDFAGEALALLGLIDIPVMPESLGLGLLGPPGDADDAEHALATSATTRSEAGSRRRDTAQFLSKGRSGTALPRLVPTRVN